MERSLSATQRDKILLTESKEDRGFKKEMVDVLRELSRNTASAIRDEYCHWPNWNRAVSVY